MSERNGAVEPAIEALRISRIESRAVLDHQIDLLNEIDDKALRTVRTSIVVLALLVSAGQIAGPVRIRSLHWLLAFAVIISVTMYTVAIVIGMAIYSVSQIPFGIGPNHRSETLNGDYTEREWLALLLAEYDEWTEETIALTENNARWLTYAQGSFVLGTMVIVVAVGVSLTQSSIESETILFLGTSRAALIPIQRVRTDDER